jgi:branched-chain amino acid transport system substrate-binding protein
MRGRGGRWAGVLLATAAALAACGGGSGSKQATPTAAPEPPATIEIASGRPLKIGVSVTLSGEQANLGADLADAVELAVRDRGATLKGHPVTVSRMDDGCADAEKAAGVARSLAGDAAVVGVIGPMCTTGAQAADSVYDAAHLVHILPAATRTDLSQQGEQYFFRTSWIDDAQARVQAAYTREKANVDTIVLIDDAEPYGRALADAFAVAFQGAGGTVASRERIERGDTDFGALVRKVNTAQADAVVFEGLSPEGPLLVEALRDGGYTGLFIAPDGLFNQRDFIDSLRDPTTGISPAEGAIVTGGPTPDAAFIAKFQDAFQRAPSTPFVLQAHDAATALLKAIEAVATEGTGGALTIDRARLEQTLRSRGLDGLTGTIRFDEHGDRLGDTPREAGLTVYKVVDGRFRAQPD